MTPSGALKKAMYQRYEAVREEFKSASPEGRLAIINEVTTPLGTLYDIAYGNLRATPAERAALARFLSLTPSVWYTGFNGHRHTPGFKVDGRKIVGKLAFDKAREVRIAVAQRHDIAAVIGANRTLARDSDEQVRLALVSNPLSPPGCAQWCVNDRFFPVRVAAAAHAGLDDADYERLADDERFEVRESLWRGGNAPDHVREALSEEFDDLLIG